MQISEHQREVHPEDHRVDGADIIMRMRRCQDCSQLMSHPTVACAQCRSHDFEQAPFPAAGHIVSWRMHYRAVRGEAHTVPMVLAIVELDEGAWIYASIETDLLALLQRGSRVELRSTSRASDFPVFAPVFTQKRAVP